MARTKTKPKPTIEQLNLLTREAIDRASGAPLSAPALPLPAGDDLPATDVYEPVADRGPFGAWLVQQHLHRREWVAGLARTAKADHRFPKRGSVDDVRKYLTGQGADGMRSKRWTMLKWSGWPSRGAGGRPRPSPDGYAPLRAAIITFWYGPDC